VNRLDLSLFATVRGDGPFNCERGIQNILRDFHLFLPFSILLQNLPGKVWKKSFQNRKNSEL